MLQVSCYFIDRVIYKLIGEYELQAYW